jgi:cytosine deaminase
MDLTIHNAIDDLNFEPINIGIENGKIVALDDGSLPDGNRSIDAEGSVISPAFIEPHFHLENSVLPEYMNKSGTLGEAIRIAEQIKDQLTAEDIMRRSTIALREAILNGVLWLRDHTDVDEVAKLDLLNAVAAVRERFKHVIDIQIVAFPQFGLADNPESVDLVWQAMGSGANLVGGVPHREKELICMLMRRTILIGTPSSYWLRKRLRLAIKEE